MMIALGKGAKCDEATFRMALISLRDVYIAFGGPWLLEAVHLQIERGERVCLLGRNSVGKST
jgi:ABC transport system ATP-binding/permease protein